jgi:lipopolysaccharide/colanic/teichoic acid biosynthesis glycosyltransferase
MPPSVMITKRLFDIIVSLLVLILFSPVWVLIAILIKLDSPGPVLYIQNRARRHGLSAPKDTLTLHTLKRKSDTFTLFKFRTMTNGAENNGAVNAVENDSRITRIGNVIRPMRIDEIPNFINVLLGHMSIVGPRADRIEIYQEVSETFPIVWERTRYVKPGITGLAQIELKSNGTLNGNKKFVNVIPTTDMGQEVMSFRFKLYYDFAYQMKLTSFWEFLKTDLIIIIKTPIIMFIRRNTI